MKTEMNVEMKVNGQPIVVDLTKVDETWLTHCLQYGVRRFINDSHSSSKGQEKYEACMLMVKDMTNGEPMPERTRRSCGGSSVDPITALALKNAKAALTAVFKQVTGKGKAIDFAEHEKVAPFFAVSDGKATWKDDTVKKWMEAQVKAGNTDYMADAKATIEGADDALKGIELDF